MPRQVNLRGDDEMYTARLNGALSVLLALGLLGPIAAEAQTTVTSRESNFELLAVDGNKLVVRDQNGTRELIVPQDFRFLVDGKSLGVSDLHAGMKGRATVSTTTIQRPVYVTTIKQGTVTYQTARSIQIKEDDGRVHKFTQSEVDDRGIRLYMGDSPIRVSQLNPGDKITAVIVTDGQPEILTAQQVSAQLAAEAEAAPAAAAPEPEPAAAETPAASPAAEPGAEAQAMEQAAPAAAPAAPAVAPAEEASVPALPEPYFKHPFFMLLVLIIIIALIWVLMRRRGKDKK
jgi:hypothetical protein